MKCVLCNNHKFDLNFIIDRWSIVTCSFCGLSRTEGKINVDYKNYEQDQKYTDFAPLFRNIFLKRYKIITSFKDSQGKILEIGSSTGELLDIFSKNGWDAWGVEPSHSSRLAKSKKLKILNTTFEKAKLEESFFDVVVINHTLEHVDNPLLVLEKSYKVLKKGGIIYIDVPNFASLSAKIAGKNWKFLHPWEHTYHFTPLSLEKCLSKVNLSVIWQSSWSGVLDVASPLRKFWFQLSHFQKSFFFDLLGIPGNIYATLANKGTNLAMIAKKE